MNQYHTMKELPRDEQPYEKCEKYGTGNLSNTELLAVLLRTGSKGISAMELARRILNPISSAEGILNLHSWTMEKLLKVRGIGKVKAVQILCICELAKRLAKASAGEGLRFTCSGSIAQYYMEEMRHEKQENLKLLLLNTRMKLIGESNISKGTVNMAIISPRELFVEALQKNAVAIVLLHNHPSGDSTPSKEDVLTTRRIRDAGALIGIELLDHIIIGDNEYASMAEHGLI
ncbi:RadC family protein [Hespellia stercorisuis]|uniref:DNA replication and repair protein RadC n=1 Tax=Hespellia stercorisuis DSM 15480 TaxID=1121950 RepID=A0A1M6N3W3_9FIRM|nr:DNA repair protein RadC [Hespellia stercorisuis]SHJ90352.1 DNA replication and repair protein RadC [Hespellia stercorisuis DSM 15480]